MAEAYGKLTGRPGIAIVTRGPGAIERGDRRPRGRAGFDADDRCSSARSAATSSTARRSRRSTTGACSAASPNGPRRSIAPSAFPNTSRTPIARAMSGRPGPVVLALPEDMLTARAASPTPRASSPWPLPPRSRRSSPRRADMTRRGAAAARAGRRQPLGRRRLPRAASSRRGAARCRSPARSATRTCSTIGTRTTRAMSASAINPKLAARVRDADVLLVDRRTAGRDDDVGLHAARRAGAARRR